eukprot:scaffold70726_cov34-Tisochrysis_lutea.AAC.1
MGRYFGIHGGGFSSVATAQDTMAPWGWDWCYSTLFARLCRRLWRDGHQRISEPKRHQGCLILGNVAQSLALILTKLNKPT